MNIYEDVKAMINELDQAGETEWSHALSQAMSISGHPGEVLGEIRLQLRLIKNSPVSQRLHLQESIEKLLAYLDQYLGS